MTPEEALGQREWAYSVRAAHDPETQGHGYERCSLCSYTRHPCEAFELADTVIALTTSPPNVEVLTGQLSVAAEWVRAQHPYNTEGMASMIDDAVFMKPK